jgi:hypothetical protein
MCTAQHGGAWGTVSRVLWKLDVEEAEPSRSEGPGFDRRRRGKRRGRELSVSDDDAAPTGVPGPKLSSAAARGSLPIGHGSTSSTPCRDGPRPRSSIVTPG